MTDVSQILRKKSKEIGVPLWVIEKDYALSYLLAATADTPGLGSDLILKGGTALRKVYFPDHRFSEDLDFTAQSHFHAWQIDDGMNAAVQQAEAMLQERGPFSVQSERFVLRDPHPGDQAAYTIQVQFPFHRRPMCRLKIEITVDEPVLLLPEEHPIFHDFEEPFDAMAYVYSLAEIVAEKLRALLQSHARLKARGWGGSRVCRDYYDLWRVLGEVDFTGTDIAGLTAQKCAIRKISIQSPEEFFAPELIRTAQTEWEAQLVSFVPTTPAPDQVIDDLKTAVLELW